MGLRALLIRERDEILRRFMNEVRGSDLTGATATRPQLLDGVPAFLDRVIAAMGDNRPASEPSLMTEAPAASAAATAAEHGTQRLALGYDIRELVREYGILGDVVIGLLAEASEPLDLEEYRQFARHISLGVAEAVGQFSDERDAAMARQAAEQFAFLAHELRGPLTVALMSMEAWKDETPDRESIADVQASILRMSRLIDSTLVSERLRSGRTQVVASIGVIDLVAVAREVAQALAPLAARRGVRLRVDVEPANLVVRGDVRLIASALGNLAGNAVKFTHERTGVLIRARLLDHVVRIDVEDECGGLPAGAVARAFEPFVQLGCDQTGFGLGLSIARQAAEAHGGQLVAEDLPGHGCRFTLTLPHPG